jgi:DsbC/DsbD-like thiol-disulfide interchange protein
MTSKSSSFLNSVLRTALLLLALFGATAALADSGQKRASVNGTVAAVDTAAGTLTIAPRHGSKVTLKTNAKTRLALDGEDATLADIPVGATASAVYDPATLTALRVEAHSGHPQAAVEGSVTATGKDSITITPEHGKHGAPGTPVKLTTNASTRVFLDGRKSTPAAIAVGDHAGALYDSKTSIAAVIHAESPDHELAEVEGKVTAVSGSSITITPEEHGAPVTLGTDASTKVILNGTASTLAAVAVGDQARALYDGSTLIASVIQAQSPHHELAEVEGKVTAVGGSSITIAPRKGAPVALATNATTQVFLDGAVSKLADIKVGDNARALYDATSLIAAVIQAESPHHELAEVEGKVTAVTSSSLTIAPEEGAAVTLGADGSTKVFLDRKTSTLAAIKVGDEALALYDSSTSIAAVIEARSKSD